MPPRSMPGDSPARFLGELRALRDEACIGHAELATRAHYPVEVLIAAEAGPYLPDLPVLAAYVRGCGGVPGEWEDRWRVLTGSPGESDLPMRPVGGSAAAEAGARAGAAAAAPDDHDPSHIMSVLSRAASVNGSASDTRAGTESGPDLGSAPDPGPGSASAYGHGAVTGTAPLNGHRRSRVFDADAHRADATPAMLPSPVPVPSSPPPVPSSAPTWAPFVAPERPAASPPARKPAHHGASPAGRGATSRTGATRPGGLAAALLAWARGTLDRFFWTRGALDRAWLTPGIFSAILVAALVLIVILIAVLA